MPWRKVFAKPLGRMTSPYHLPVDMLSSRLIICLTSSLMTWSVYGMCMISQEYFICIVVILHCEHF